MCAGGGSDAPPSSLAMTSALPSPVVKAMELYELPKDMPIATRWAGSVCALILRGAEAGGVVEVSGLFCEALLLERREGRNKLEDTGIVFVDFTCISSLVV